MFHIYCVPFLLLAGIHKVCPDIGNPADRGEILHLNKVSSEHQEIVTWMSSTQSDSPIDHYELRQIIKNHNGHQPIVMIISIKGTTCTLVRSTCKSNFGSLSIRAVYIVQSPSTLANESHVRHEESTLKSGKICREQDDYMAQPIQSGIPVHGNWSSPLQMICKTGNSYNYHIALIPICIVCVVLTIYGAVTARKKLIDVTNIKVEWPHGLEDVKQDSVEMTYTVELYLT